MRKRYTEAENGTGKMTGGMDMGVVKRAYLYVMRKKVRSILLFLIFFVSGLFLLTGLSIKQGAKKAAEDVRKTLTAGLRIEIGRAHV